MRKIPFLDLQATYLELKEEIDAAVARVLSSGWYLLGKETQAFEQEFAHYAGAKHCIGIANGLDALLISLKAMGVGPGDEVIVPSNTYIATWLAVSYAGATPIPVEPDLLTCNLDPLKVEAAITSKTKVMIPVHLYGQTADMEAINAIAKKHGITVLEDAAQSHGAKFKNSPAGSLGHVASWSFYPGKNLGAFSDAGAITTDDDQLADRIRTLRNYGSRVKYVNEVQGYNSRIDEMQSAILRVKLKHLDQWNQRRKELAQNYTQALKDLPVILPHVPAWADPVWHLYVIRTPLRDQVQQILKQEGIETLIHYPIPPHMQQAYQDLKFQPEDFPLAKKLAAEQLSLPIGPHLSAKDQAYIIETLQKAIKQVSK
jgi:dTDP-4-amino-4,6-dideoxygalactose transaminase